MLRNVYLFLHVPHHHRQKVSVRMEEVDSIRSELGIRETVQIGWRKLFCCTDRFEVRETFRLAVWTLAYSG